MKVCNPYRVFVVVDRAFGHRLELLPPGEPVWVVDSNVNTPVAHRLWEARAEVSHLQGITTFRGSCDSSPEEDFLGDLDTVDLHHGKYSAQPPYSILEVIGCPPSERIQVALGEIGFEIASTAPDGFVAVRRSA